MKRTKVCKRFKFDAAHYLPNYDGQCKKLHGHRWFVDVCISGFTNKETGMVVDFNEIKTVIGTTIDKLDHTLLNDTILNPTAENLSEILFNAFEQYNFSNASAKVVFVKVWETEDNYAEYPC